MAASSSLTLVREFTFGGVMTVREYTGTADEQTAVAHGGQGEPDICIISDFLDTEVACAITAKDATNITYGAASSTTAKIYLIWQDGASGGIS